MRCCDLATIVSLKGKLQCPKPFRHFRTGFKKLRDRFKPTNLTLCREERTMPYSNIGGHLFKLAKETSQLEVGLNVRITTWNDAKETLELDINRFRETPAEKLGQQMHQIGHGLHARRVLVLRDELVLVADLVRYYQLLERDRRVAAELAVTRHAEVVEKLKADLLRLGYVDGIIPGGNQICLTPDMIKRHPAVFATRNEADALQQASFNGNISLHEVRSHEIRAEIEAIRDRTLTTA